MPSVATTRACVSPRVNSAEPWVRGSMPTSERIERTVFRSRPSMRRPVSRMELRTTVACAALKASASAWAGNLASPSAGASAAIIFFFAASSAL